MAYSSAISIKNIWRFLENYDIQFGTSGSDDSNLVTVLNLTSSRGVLVAFGGGGTKTVDVKVTLDGSVEISRQDFIHTDVDNGGTVPVLIGFSSSCKVEMSLSSVGVGRFWALALVEV